MQKPREEECGRRKTNPRPFFDWLAAAGQNTPEPAARTHVYLLRLKLLSLLDTKRTRVRAFSFLSRDVVVAFSWPRVLYSSTVVNRISH